MDYFIIVLGKEADMMAGTKITKELHDKYSDIFRHWVLQRHIFFTGQGRFETIPGAT